MLQLYIYIYIYKPLFEHAMGLKKSARHIQILPKKKKLKNSDIKNF